MIKPSGSLANKQTREVRQTYFSLHFSSAFIRNAHILYLMPLYISVVKRGGGGVKWAFAREPEPEPERVREHELLYMGGGGTVGMGWGDWGGGWRPTFVHIYSSMLGFGITIGWQGEGCNRGCSKHKTQSHPIPIAVPTKTLANSKTAAQKVMSS